MSFSYETSSPAARDKVRSEKRGAPGVAKSAEHRAKIAASNRAFRQTAEGHRMLSRAAERMRTFWRSPEGRAKRMDMRPRMIEGIIQSLHRPATRAKHLAAIQRNARASVFGQMSSEANKRTWSDPLVRERRVRGIKAALAKSDTIAKKRTVALQSWQDQTVRERRTAWLRDPNKKAAQSRNIRAAWMAKDPEKKLAHIARIWSHASTHPNKLENAALGVLRRAFPGVGWKFNTGTIIAGKIPDLIRDGGRVVVDIHGDYWHRHETRAQTRARVKLFLGAGYTLVIVWEHEFKRNPDLLVRRVIRAERRRGIFV